MIGWSITVGYISGYSQACYDGETWEILKKESLRITPDDLHQEAIKATTFGDAMNGYIREVADTYTTEGVGNPLHINDNDEYILITASGGGEYRPAKEYVARAFCRLLMRAMHSHNIDICISVA